MIATFLPRLRRHGGASPAILGTPVSTREARVRILAGTAPPNLHVSGHLDLSHQADLAALPAGLSVTSLDLTGCAGLRRLPDDLQARRLVLSGCTSLYALPAGLRCYELVLRHTPIRALPEGVRVAFSLDLTGCTRLERLPAGLKVGSLVLRGCTGLAALPDGLDVCFLDVSGCAQLTGWPERGSAQLGRLVARDCIGLAALPPWMTRLTRLDVRGCTNLRALPEWLEISSWVDVAGTGITHLPPAARRAAIRWRGVPVDERIAFQPQTITVQEVLRERNVARRRVLLERMGYQRFLAEAGAAVHAQVLDRDVDRGGERRLVRVAFLDDEPLVCVLVVCPSTGKQHVLRVPPETRTCHQAVAWVGGFDDADEYRPVAET
jgi:hypothetical protein